MAKCTNYRASLISSHPLLPYIPLLSVPYCYSIARDRFKNHLRPSVGLSVCLSALLYGRNFCSILMKFYTDVGARKVRRLSLVIKIRWSLPLFYPNRAKDGHQWRTLVHRVTDTSSGDGTWYDMTPNEWQNVQTARRASYRLIHHCLTYPCFITIYKLSNNTPMMQLYIKLVYIVGARSRLSYSNAL